MERNDSEASLGFVLKTIVCFMGKFPFFSPCGYLSCRSRFNLGINTIIPRRVVLSFVSATGEL